MSFSPISSHKGEASGKELEQCLPDLEIEKSFSMTVNNAASNDMIVSYLKKRATD